MSLEEANGLGILLLSSFIVALSSILLCNVLHDLDNFFISIKSFTGVLLIVTRKSYEGVSYVELQSSCFTHLQFLTMMLPPHLFTAHLPMTLYNIVYLDCNWV